MKRPVVFVGLHLVGFLLLATIHIPLFLHYPLHVS